MYKFFHNNSSYTTRLFLDPEISNEQGAENVFNPALIAFVYIRVTLFFVLFISHDIVLVNTLNLIKKNPSQKTWIFWLPLLGSLFCGKATAGKHPTGVFSGSAFRAQPQYNKNKRKTDRDCGLLFFGSPQEALCEFERIPETSSSAKVIVFVPLL